ncbi:MAG: hypothetical protein M4579_000424 [Chaenotheca gracillima]|nr:MAG: hypothetical protein M4579_000424 [Chaenotheca gracillima]
MASNDSVATPESVSGGLHNLVTGLTIRSPTMPSPSTPGGLEPASSSSAGPLTTSSSAFSSIFNNRSRTNASAELHDRTAPSTVATHSLATETPPSSSSSQSSRRGKKRQTARIQKEVDDLTTPVGDEITGEAARSATPTRLTSLFASTTSHSPSRQSSNNTPKGDPNYVRASADEIPLPCHLYTRGFLQGRHSDITIHAFGTSYALHRLLLDRAPFFSSALSEPWCESAAKDITLRPEEVDANITKSAFESALKRLYGSCETSLDAEEAFSLFATGSWLEMGEIVDTCVDTILQQMCTAQLSTLINKVSRSYYGGPGQRLLSCAKAMLYREGWGMPLKYWDGISGELVREIVGGDGFYIEDERERWLLSKRLLNRRLKLCSKRLLSESPSVKNSDHAAGTSRFHKSSGATAGSSSATSDMDHLDLVYNDPDVAPMLNLLESGIHYTYLTFEQLQFIKSQRDCFGSPVTPPDTIAQALWMAMELRQHVVNAPDTALELGLVCRKAVESDANCGSETMKRTDSDTSANSGTSSGWVKVDSEPVSSFDPWDSQAERRKFFIPSQDSTSVIGDGPEDRHTTQLRRIPPKGLTDASTMGPQSTHGSRSIDSSPTPENITRVIPTPHLGIPTPESSLSSPRSFTYYPPYRFSVSFPNPRVLKERKRVYSRTVWYAGSMWKIYVQKVRSSKNTQLGVYLHRAKEREVDEYVGRVASARSVDERIGNLERDMLLQKTERTIRRLEQMQETQLEEGEGSSSSGDHNAVAYDEGGSSQHGAMPASRGQARSGKQPSTLRLTPTSRAADIRANEFNLEDDSDDDDEDFEDDAAAEEQFSQIPTFPQYTDTRPTIKTYFKIFSPSKGGRMLSVYESAPDGFNFSQSWGWKSSTLILDDGTEESDDPNAVAGTGRLYKDSRLRFSVILGNV